MPKLDGKGPQGKGPRTGRGLGNCEPKKINLLTKLRLFLSK